MNIREHPNLITTRLPRRIQAHPDSLYSPSKRTTDLSHSISESHARQKHPYDATPTRSTTSSVQASAAPYSLSLVRQPLPSPSSSSSSARRRDSSPLLLVKLVNVFFFSCCARKILYLETRAKNTSARCPFHIRQI